MSAKTRSVLRSVTVCYEGDTQAARHAGSYITPTPDDNQEDLKKVREKAEYRNILSPTPLVECMKLPSVREP